MCRVVKNIFRNEMVCKLTAMMGWELNWRLGVAKMEICPINEA